MAKPAAAPATAPAPAIEQREWALLKRLYPEAPDEQLELFVMRAKKAGLDPLSQQIHLLQRKSKDRTTGQWVPTWTIMVGIDGLRAIADRTEAYAPGRTPEFQEDAQGRLVSATAYVMKFVRNQWFEVSASAYYAEYVQLKDGQPVQMWQKMPRSQLAKCAEAIALRRAFPAETFGLYEAAEIAATTETETTPAPAPVAAFRPTDRSAPVAPVVNTSGKPDAFVVMSAKSCETAKGTPYLALRLGAPNGTEQDAIMLTNGWADAEKAMSPGTMVKGVLAPNPSNKPGATQVFTPAEAQ